MRHQVIGRGFIVEEVASNYELKIEQIESIEQLQFSGRSLVYLGLIQDQFYLRIFLPTGEIIKDVAQEYLEAGFALERVKDCLQVTRQDELSAIEREEIIAAAFRCSGCSEEDLGDTKLGSYIAYSSAAECILGLSLVEPEITAKIYGSKERGEVVNLPIFPENSFVLRQLTNQVEGEKILVLPVGYDLTQEALQLVARKLFTDGQCAVSKEIPNEYLVFKSFDFHPSIARGRGVEVPVGSAVTTESLGHLELDNAQGLAVSIIKDSHRLSLAGIFVSDSSECTIEFILENQEILEDVAQEISH